MILQHPARAGTFRTSAFPEEVVWLNEFGAMDGFGIAQPNTTYDWSCENGILILDEVE